MNRADVAAEPCLSLSLAPPLALFDTGVGSVLTLTDMRTSARAGPTVPHSDSDPRVYSDEHNVGPTLRSSLTEIVRTTKLSKAAL